LRAVLLAILVAFLAVVALTWPVCDPIDPEEVRTMEPPIQMRRQERTLWFHTYRVRERRWCRCQPWVLGKLFF
jgi:hypothetical protein